MQNKRKNRARAKKGRILVTLGIILLAFLLLVTIKVEPALSGICDYKSRIYAYDIINDSIDAEFIEDDLQCEDFLEFMYDSSGNIAAVNADMIFANETVGRVATAVRKRYEASSTQEYNIHIGDLSDCTFLYGRGFTLPVVIKPQGWIETNVLTDFTETGINQTTVKIMVEVKMTMTSQLATYSKATEIYVCVPIAQTTIIGEIPNYIGSGVIAGTTN